MLIAVATPYGAHLEHPEVMRRVEFLKSRMLNCKFVTAEISMHIVSLARTKLVEQCLVAGADAIFFVDSDVLIPENAYILFDHLSDEHHSILLFRVEKGEDGPGVLAYRMTPRQSPMRS